MVWKDLACKIRKALSTEELSREIESLSRLHWLKLEDNSIDAGFFADS